MRLWILYLVFQSAYCSAQNTGDIRLFGGNGNAGIVQVYHSDTWQSVCGWNFRGLEASVVCRELGYLQGEPLPLGAFGELSGISSYPAVLNKCATGQEASLMDCEFDNDTMCSQAEVAYASVNCFNTTTVLPDPKTRLESTSPNESGYFAGISVYRAAMWGRVCATFWDNNDASVVCRQLGYNKGIAVFQEGDSTVPFLLSEINCVGNESAIADCPQATEFCYNDRSAAVICYNNQTQGPSFSLVGGHSANYGKVVVNIDGNQGLVCNGSYHDGSATSFSWREAYALCKTMGFTSGTVLDTMIQTPGIDTIVLEGVSCQGDEESIFECTNPGWKDTSEKCQSQEAGVVLYCYSTGRLTSGSRVDTENYQMGRVELLDNDVWYAVCGDVFNEISAGVMCSDLGFPTPVVLTPDSFGNKYTTKRTYVNSLACAGTEASLAECQYTLGRCSNYDHHAALLCKQLDSSDNVQMKMSGSYFGEIIVTMYGVEGTVCMAGWDNNEADVVCKAAGFATGIVLAGRLYQTRYKPLWAFNFECMGGENRLEDCAYETAFRTADWTCAEDTTSAGVLCFVSAPPDQLVRLQDGPSDSEGRVEVYSDTSGWGTICNSGWSISDAKVFCRQLGYADGQPSRSQLGSVDANMPVLLSNVQCEGTERTIFQCPNSGWNKVSSTCVDHSKDASVYCYRHVSLQPFHSFGPVQYHDGETYGLVCADSFGDVEASVVCKELEFTYSMVLCCSAFGPPSSKFTMSNLKCTGLESSMTDCSSETQMPQCTSGQYASVACSSYNFGFSQISAAPVVEVTYFLYDGFVCTDGFTDNDAVVMCKQEGYTFGYAYKTSAAGLERKIRWLNGLNCIGTENSFQDCGPHDWGQIGVCRWDAVAAVMCSNKQDDMEFKVRLVNGTVTAGRLEVYIKSRWGTVCGNDLTKSEAVVVCQQLGYHDGIRMEPGQYGEGSGSILLDGFKCQGNESNVKECVWSGYGATSPLCDHSKDAAIFCYSNVRLSGSTTINYGRLEIFNEDDSDWVAVCDRNQAVNSAVVLCRILGYTTGMFQRGSALGPTTRKIAIEIITCSSQTDCTFTKGECPTGKYVALYCSQSTIVNEELSLRVPLSSFYGPVSVKRFGLWGHMCGVGFDDADAEVVCLELGYQSGTALQTYATHGHPIIQGDVRCTGTETKFEDCPRGLFATDPGCYNENTVAAVICYSEDGVSYGETPVNRELGEMRSFMEVKANGQTLRVDMNMFEDVDAAVYCSSLAYAGGQAFRQGSGNYGVSDLTCTGTEETILQCPGVWDPSKTKDQIGDLAGVVCYTSVRLEGGDPAYYGAVITSKGVNSGPVCAAGFDETDAVVACKNLNFEAGLVLCCSAVGSLDDPGILTNVRCSGSERQFTDCLHDDVDPDHAESCKIDYAAVACYSGQKPTAYSLRLGGDSTYTGTLVLRYLDTDGSVCIDDWGDSDAHVACQELGFSRGVAYTAARSDPAPFWTSQVGCEGTEVRISDCQMTEFGKVRECSNKLSQAGVICYNNDGIFYRLGGSGEYRYGRVEVSLNGEWRSLCNLYWENADAHVLCKMLSFRTGEAYQGALRDTMRGPVWEANFMCDGTETSLYQCMSTGWRVSTVPACALHQNDAATFCYRSVKLSTGVGRETDHGAVLLYYMDNWYTICNKGFTDTSAQVVCRELGFVDGHVQVGTSYGALAEYPRLSTHTVRCSGQETDVTNCMIAENCDAQDYVSVVCYGFTLTTTEKPTPVAADKFNVVPIVVAVVLFVALVAVGLIVLYCLRKRRKQRKLERSKETFDHTILSENVDGSVEVSNQLHGMVNTPELSRVHYANRRGNEVIDMERSYNNAAYESTGKEREDSQYDRIPERDYTNLRKNIGDSHAYDNLPENQAERMRGTVTNSEDIVRDDSEGASYFISPFAASGVIESPTGEAQEPNWSSDSKTQ